MNVQPPQVPSEVGVKAWKWRQWAIMGGALIVTSLLTWLLVWRLSPRQWCQTSFDMARVDGGGIIAGLQACLNLQVEILGIYKVAAIGLIGLLAITNVLFMVSEFRVGAKAQGPGGFGFELGNDDAPRDPVVQKIEGEVVLTPEEESAAGRPSG